MEAVSRLEEPRLDPAAESRSSGVSWSAVAAGAFVTAANSFLLMMLGAGMGLSSISPWPDTASVSRIAPGAIVWIILVQLLSCCLGGYVAGRLRTKWVAVHDHEVYFRDTAHGLLVWAVSFVLASAFLSSFAASLARDATRTADDTRAGAGNYFVDTLFRAAPPADAAADLRARTEARTILARAVAQPERAADDKTYLASLVSTRTGISSSEAARRVDAAVAQSREAADAARKAVAHSLYWLVVALLAGAFGGSYAAIIGGRQRDRVHP
jgi:hypothetical protein